MKRKMSSRYRIRHNTIIESVLVMLLLCLIFFGLLQIMHLYVAQIITDYAAACTVRSSVVGYDDYLLRRSAMVGGIAASGNMLMPIADKNSSPIKQFENERSQIPKFIQGYNEMKYKESDNLTFTDRPYGNEMRRVNLKFSNYKLDFPFLGFFRKKDTIDIEGNATVFDHASFFLEN